MKRFEMFKIMLFSLVILLATAGILSADTHYVTPGQSIQQAINAASDYDQIEVAPGTYYEAINFNGRAVRLYSRDGNNVTTINGNGACHVVQCVNGEDANTILEGFTITGGNADGDIFPDDCGGGMLNTSSSPKVIDCNFFGNSTGHGHDSLFNGEAGGNAGDGAGMANFNSSPILTNCTFSENSTGRGGQGAIAVGFDVNGSNGGNGGGGAGVYNYYSSPTLTNCIFSQNTTGKGGNGGTSLSTIAGCGGEGGSGAGMANFNSSPDLNTCYFSENITGDGGTGAFSLLGTSGNGGNSGSGAGMFNTYYSSPVVTACSFTKNQTGNGGSSDGAGGIESIGEQYAQDGGYGGESGSGAGMCNKDSSSPTVSNCKFTENKCGSGGNGGIGGSIYVSMAAIAHDKAYAGNGGKGGDGGKGGGMDNNSCSPIVTGCTFTQNQSGNGGYGGQGGYTTSLQFPYFEIINEWPFVSFKWLWTYPGEGGKGGDGGDGGGIYSVNSSPNVIKCSFSGNINGNGGNGGAGGVPLVQPKEKSKGGNGGDGGDGAGICYLSCSASDINDCAFFDNKTSAGGMAGIGTCLWVFKWQSTGTPGSGGNGGGIDVNQASPIVTNCTFRGNAAWYGGGMHNSGGSPTVTNCTFKDNFAKNNGGGTYGSSGSPSLTNCILWGDEPNEIAGTAPNATYCDVEGGYTGTGNIDAPPAFADDNGRLSLGSICINAGSNSAPNIPAKDFDGNPRITGTTADMGAFEYTDLRIRNATTDILYGSIQGAIDDANNGDEICVLPGTYSSAVDFSGKAVRLYSTSGPDFTTIDGSGAYNVVKCVSGENANTILEGFTITGGDANGYWPNDAGGGMFNSGSSPTVTNCIFIDNSGTYCGGMFNDTSSPTVTNCNFISNSALIGGGMANAYSSSPTVTNCTFSSNHVSYNGAGMFNDTVSPIVTNCTFSGNFADQYGGGMYNRNCSPKMIHCIFGSNQAQYGGGVFNNDNSNPIVTNCNFLYNSASVNGGGMANYTNSNPTVTNCILWEDYATDEIYNVSSNPFVTYCDVNMLSGTYPGTGNINADPGFSLAIIAGRPECSNYFSSSASPCVDAGDNNVLNLPATDMGGQSRVVDGDIDGNSTVDIGAYELQPCVKNVTRNRWYQLIQHSVEDACDYDRIEVPPGTYYESVDFMNAPTNFVLTSIDPNDPNIVEQTIIDAKFGGHVLTFTSQGPSCIVAGFTLTVSGNPLMVPGFGYGIGSYGQTTSPTINNCVITNTRGVRFDYGSPALSGCTIKDNYGGLTVADDNAIIEDCIIAKNFGIEGNGLYCAVETGWGNTILRRCVVSGNQCEYAAISCMGDTTIEDCVISDNTGMMGAVWSSGSPSAGKMSGCTISNNKGSGINSWAGSIENSIITGNASNDDFPIWEGGGISIATGPITNCIIQGNKAEWGGGLSRCSGAITNCIISGNVGTLQGGGLNNCDGSISNCIIAGNVAWKDEYGTSGLGGGLYGCSGTISNSIIWQNFAQTDGNNLYSSSVPSYSCIEGWTGGGTGNITADPCFAIPGNWADINDPNAVVSPDDPNAVWVDGFYRLSWASPCIDAGDNAVVPGGVVMDIGGLPRFSNTCKADTGSGTPPIVDMGAYEFQGGAGIDGRGTADMMDFNLLASQWMNTGCGLCNGADLTCDGNVDLFDLSELLNYWLVAI